MKFVGLAMLVAALAAGPGTAGPLSDLVMAPGLLAAAPDGEVFRYSYDRRLPARADGAGAATGVVKPRAVAGGKAILSKVAGADGPMLQLSLDEGGGPKVVAEFSAAGPNPLLLFFLENVVRNMTVQTGGNPVYIRNRIRDALVAADGGAVSGETAEVVLHPFETDPNRARMGDFGALGITLRYDPADPGRLVELLADTGTAAEGYSEAMRLIPEE